MGATASELVLEVLAAKREVRSLPSEDGGAAKQEHRCFADNRGAVGGGVGCLEKRCGGAACGVVTPVCSPVGGFVEGKDIDGLLRADKLMSSPKAGWAKAGTGEWMKGPLTEWSAWRRVAVANRGKRGPSTVTSSRHR
jgi:hypothetical protein